MDILIRGIDVRCKPILVVNKSYNNTFLCFARCLQSTSHTNMYTPRHGLGKSSSRMCLSLSAINASIVTRLASRALTGKCLHLNIHQHLGFSVHVTWRISADVTMKYYSATERCFARCFDTNDEYDAFCEELKQIPIDGLCDSMGYMEYMLRLLQALNRIHRCHLYPLPTAETMDKPKWKRRALESDGLFRCPCPISSSARVFKNSF